MNKPIPVRWTDRSLRNGQSIQTYLENNFSPKQVKKFYKMLEDFEQSVSQLPELYPLSIKHADLRKATLNNIFQ